MNRAADISAELKRFAESHVHHSESNGLNANGHAVTGPRETTTDAFSLVETKNGQGEEHDQGLTNGNKPVLALPSNTTEFEECGEKCFSVMAKTHRYFIRGRRVVELV